MKFVKFESPMVRERNLAKTSERIGISKGCTVGRNYFRYRITLLSLNKLRSNALKYFEHAKISSLCYKHFMAND